MDYRLSAEEQAFQKEVLAFIENDLPEGYDRDFETLDERMVVERQVMKLLAERRWLALPWPKEYGGLDATPMQQLIFNELMSYNGVPGAVNMGVAWVGPTIILYGTDEQKERYLKPIAEGKEIWCTLYSEPGAGSDLAAMQTRAVLDGDDYVINGQKIWTTFGHYADWGWLAARTDPDVPKHKGLSTFAIDMKTPGITTRPLVNMAGTHEFNEIFFDNVRVPKEALVGELNRGWYQVAVGLEFERSSIGATSGARKSLENLVSYARTTTRDGRPLIEDPTVRAKLADLTVEVNVSRAMSYQVAYRQTKGDLPGHQANVVKTFTMELNQRIQRAALQIGGLYGQLAEADPRAMAGGDYAYGYLRSVANTIEGGTSEVNRTVIATRGLGLPRE